MDAEDLKKANDELAAAEAAGTGAETEDSSSEPVDAGATADDKPEADVIETPEALAAAKEDQKVRSRLGRKFKEMEDRTEQRLASIEEGLARLLSSGRPDTGQTGAEFDIPTSREQFDQEVARVLARKDAERKAYENKFAATFNQMAETEGLDEETQKLVENKFFTQYNSGAVKSGRPDVDAELAFTRAYNAVLREAKPKLVAKSKTAPAIKAPASQNRGAGSAKSAHSEEVKTYAKTFGWSEDKVAKILKNGGVH